MNLNTQDKNNLTVTNETNVKAAESEKADPLDSKKTDGTKKESTKPKNTQIDIEVDSAGQRSKLIFTLAWPALAENILVSMINMVSMIMVGGLGGFAINAVGLVSQPRFIMMSAVMAMNIGTTALVAQSKGANNQDGANSALSQALILTAFIVLSICSVMFFLAEPLIRMIAGSGLSEQVISQSLIYMRIQIFGFPFTAFTLTVNAALRGAGNTKAAFYNNAVANVVNAALHYCLIYGNLGFPRLEIAGASLAAVLSQAVALMMALSVVLRNKQYIRLDIRSLTKLDLPMMRRIMKIGIPSLIEQLFMRAGNIWFTSIVTSLGNRSYTAHMVAMNIEMLAFTTGQAFGAAATTLVGQSIGRRRMDLSRVYVRVIQTMGFVVSVVVSLLLFFCGHIVARLYTSDLEIIALAISVLRIIAVVIPIVNARTIYLSALRGAGDAKFVAVVSFVGMVAIRPVVGLLLTNVFEMGLAGIWFALSSDFIIGYVITLGRYVRGKWEHIII